VLRVVARVTAHDVAPRLRTRAPGQLPLDEAEDAGRRYSPLWARELRFDVCTA
jgi:hypothetical protein